MKKNIFVSSLLMTIVFFLSVAFINQPKITPSDKTLKDLVAIFPKPDNQAFEISKGMLMNQINNKEVEQKKRNYNQINYEFGAFLPFMRNEGKFSRMPIYYKAVKMYETPQHFAFIYLQNRGFGNSIYERYYITVLNKDGLQIHNENVSIESKEDEITAFKITPDLKLDRQVYKIIWQDTKDNYNRKAASMELKKEEVIDLTDYKPTDDQPWLKHNKKSKAAASTSSRAK